MGVNYDVDFGAVFRRIGGLEMHAIVHVDAGNVFRRIGGLEILSNLLFVESMCVPPNRRLRNSCSSGIIAT